MPKRSDRFSSRVQVVHPYAWLWEPLAEEPTFVVRAMFGAKAVYLHGKMVLCFCASEEPWRGVLVCTGREHHAALQAEFPELTPHSILPKWLYLPESINAFESVAARLVQAARRGDERIGIVPQTRKRRSPPAAKKRKRP